MDTQQSSPMAVPAPGLAGRWLAPLTRFRRTLVALAGGGAVLRGLAGGWNTCNAVRTASGTVAGAAAAASAPRMPLSVLVLPFANQTGDVQKACVADGLSASLTTGLSRIQDARSRPWP